MHSLNAGALMTKRLLIFQLVFAFVSRCDNSAGVEVSVQLKELRLGQ